MLGTVAVLDGTLHHAGQELCAALLITDSANGVLRLGGCAGVRGLPVFQDHIQDDLAGRSGGRGFAGVLRQLVVAGVERGHVAVHLVGDGLFHVLLVAVLGALRRISLIIQPVYQVRRILVVLDVGVLDAKREVHVFFANREECLLRLPPSAESGVEEVIHLLRADIECLTYPVRDLRCAISVLVLRFKILQTAGNDGASKEIPVCSHVSNNAEDTQASDHSHAGFHEALYRSLRNVTCRAGQEVVCGILVEFIEGVLVSADAVLHAGFKEGGKHGQLTGLRNCEVFAVSDRNVPVAILRIVGKLLVVLLLIIVPIIQSIEHGRQCRTHGDIGNHPAADNLCPVRLRCVRCGDPAAELVEALHAGVEERDHLVDLPGNVTAAPEVHRDVAGLVKGLLGIHAGLPHELVGRKAGTKLHGIADEGDPVQGIHVDLLLRKRLAGLFCKVTIRRVCAGLSAAHCQVFLKEWVRIVALDLVHVGTSHRGKHLDGVPHLGIGEEGSEIPREVGEQGPDDVVARDVPGHEPAHDGVCIQDAVHLLGGHIGDGGKHQRVVDLPELLLPALQNGNHIPVCLASAVLGKDVVQIADDAGRLVLVRLVHGTAFDPVRELRLNAGHIELALYHRGRNFFEESSVGAQVFRFVRDPAHDIVSDASIHHLNQVIDDIIHRMNDVEAAATRLLDGAVLVGKAALCSDAPFLLADGAVERDIELPALRPFLCGLLGNKAGINAPGLQEVRLELVQPFRNFLELRVLLFKLCLPVLHPYGAVLPIIGKDAHTFRKALRPVLHGQVFTEQFVLLLVVQVKPVEGSLQTGSHILPVGVREVAGDDLSRNGVTVRRVCGQLIGVGSGSLVELPDSVIAVHPRLIEDVGLCLDLLSPCAGIRCPILPQADRACGGICIQGIVGVYIVRQLFQQGCVLRREAVQEVLCELRVINRGSFTVLEELADVLCIAFA